MVVPVPVPVHILTEIYNTNPDVLKAVKMLLVFGL
jgi:hypothetical protein